MMEQRKRRTRRSRKRFPVHVQRLPALLLLPLFGWLLVTSFQQMTASIVNTQTSQFLAFWQAERKDHNSALVLSEQAIKTARQGAERALTLAPQAPEYLVSLGKVEDWVAAEGERAGYGNNAAGRQRGLQAYRHALLQRPAWPYNWAEFAMAKAQASEIDPEFFAALKQAALLGPWEPAVLDTVSRLSLWYGPWLPEDVGKVASNSLADYASHFPRQAMAVARSQGKTREVCLLVRQPQWFKDCAQ